MPYVCKAPISRKVGDDRVKFDAGDHVTDELAKELRKTHAHALTRVPHTSYNCQKSCTHHSHPWNQPAATKPEKPRKATAEAPTEGSTK